MSLICLQSSPSICTTHPFPGAYLPELRTLHSIIHEIAELRIPRLETAIIAYMQVSSGLVHSWQLGMLGMFAGLEALFPTSGNKAISLAKRVSSFLSPLKLPGQGGLFDWIKSGYELLYRNRLAHGLHDAALTITQTSKENHLAFLRLHEILRFCILGVIDLGAAESKSILSGSGPKLQSKLDALANPNGCFTRTAMKSLVGIDVPWQGVG